MMDWEIRTSSLNALLYLKLLIRDIKRSCFFNEATPCNLFKFFIVIVILNIASVQMRVDWISVESEKNLATEFSAIQISHKSNNAIFSFEKIIYHIIRRLFCLKEHPVGLTRRGAGC